MSLPEIQNAPQVGDYGLAVSKQSRLNAGVTVPTNGDWNYVDAWNQARLAQYNNDYNYWLWQQQAEYNSPSNQVARLKAAGLNPNFNSIDGTGNLGNMPTSSASISPSIGRNRNASIGNAISSINSIIGAIGQGVETMSKLSDLPPLFQMKNYRDALYRTARSNMRTQEYKEFRQLVGTLMDSMFAGANLPDDIYLMGPQSLGIQGFGPDGAPLETGTIHFKPGQGLTLQQAQQRLTNMGIDADIKTLVKEAKSYYNTNILPKEKERAEGAAGMASVGKFIEKVEAGEQLTWREWMSFILAASAMKFL